MSEPQAVWPAEEDGRMGPEPSGLPTAPPSPREDAGRLERIEAELSGVEVALRRLDEGTYGTCETCEAGLAPAAITADPLTTRCPQHAA
jgi:DnaK suppressor protein